MDNWKITFGGKPMTLVGKHLAAGDRAPLFEVIDQNLRHLCRHGIVGVKPRLRGASRRAVRRQPVPVLERNQRVLRLRAEYAVRHAAEVVQLNQPLLQSVNVVARHADAQRARLIRVRRRHRTGCVFRIRGI